MSFCRFLQQCLSERVDPALGIQLLRSHLLGFSNNEKKIAKLQDRSSNSYTAAEEGEGEGYTEIK